MLRPSTYLTNKEKSRLVGWTFFFLAERFPIIKTQLLDSVQQLVIKLEKKIFINDRPWKTLAKDFFVAILN